MSFRPRYSLVPVPVVLFAALACERPPASEITVVDGATTTHFAVRSAYAEYVELPGDHNELRLTLASYAVSCERWRPPRDDEDVLTVVIVTPAGVPPAVSSYGWTGIPSRDEPLHAPYALPKAQFGSRSRLFEPGGEIHLAGVLIDPHGTVSGTLAFEFPGEGERPATRIDGGFQAKMCRLALGAR
ncbi:MAG TPA: hypothetical protein VF395_10015 [Polyangiaceae bacterium]